jgi:hypothetical protein
MIPCLEEHLAERLDLVRVSEHFLQHLESAFVEVDMITINKD